MSRISRLTSVCTLILFAGLLVAGLSAPRAHADTITVSPPKFELFGNPGDTITEKLKVRNDGANDVVYQTEVEDFSASGDEGGVNIIDDPDAPTTSFSLRRWITVEPSRFTVPAGQEKIVNFVVRIPRDGEPGGHYATIQIKLAGEAVAGGGASVESRLNTLVLLRVSGNLNEKVSVESFHSDKDYYQSGPVNFTLKTKNEGNVHVAPTGTIVVTDIFGRKVKEVPLRVANVLPDSSRSIKTEWGDKNLLGRYTATLVATYGQDKKPITASTSFYVVPTILIWIVLGIVVVILLSVTQRRKVKKFLHRLTSD